jgi:hypothetical protein
LRSARRQLEETKRLVGMEPPWSAAELDQMRGAGSDVDRVLFDWEESCRPTTEADDGSYLEWVSWWREPDRHI